MSQNNIVTKSDLGEFYEKILPYLNGQVPIHLNQFDKSNLYSTTEKMIGQFLDGKPLYQKTVNFGTLPNNTTKTVAHGISNIDKVISIQGFANDSANNSIPIPYVTTSDAAAYSILMFREGSNIRIDAKTNWSTYNAYIILEYTKTTDSALPVKYADANDYSTTEQIVGTWIDSKPLYQKTIQATTPVSTSSSNNTVTQEVSISNVDTVVSVNGFIKTSTNQNIPLPSVWVSGFLAGVISTVASASKVDVVIYVAEASHATWKNAPAYITIQYTKTT